jgi:cytochrome c oxidase subunit II
MTQATPPDDAPDRAEHRRATVSVALLVLLVVMATFAALYHGAMPQTRVETADPRTLHLGGEFIGSTWAVGSSLTVP